MTDGYMWILASLLQRLSGKEKVGTLVILWLLIDSQAVTSEL